MCWHRIAQIPGARLSVETEFCMVTLLLLLSVGLPVANAPDVLQPCGLLYYT